MGINFYTKSKKFKVDYDIGYGGMKRLREKIAILLDEEFGNHYATLSIAFQEEDYIAFNQKANDIIERKKLSEEVLDFLFQSDCEGKINHKQCQEIYEIIKDNNEEGTFRYAYYSKNDWEDFKQILLNSAKEKVNLYWR